MAQRKIVYMPLDDIPAADRNPKDHDEEVIAGSIGRFGFVEPPVLDERTGKLVGGHGRTDDLRRRRDAGEQPPEGVVVKAGVWTAPVVRGWSSRTDDEAHALGIALNRAGERGGWKNAELFELLTDLSGTEGGLDGIGFDNDDLDDLVARMQEDAVAFDDDDSGYATGKGNDRTGSVPSIADRAQRYSGKGVRSLVLDYKLDTFDEVAALCAQLRRARGCDNNAELVEKLVREEVARAAEAEPATT